MKFMPFCIPSILINVSYTMLPDFGERLILFSIELLDATRMSCIVYQISSKELSYQQKTSSSKEDEEAADQYGRNAGNAAH